MAMSDCYRAIECEKLQVPGFSTNEIGMMLDFALVGLSNWLHFVPLGNQGMGNGLTLLVLINDKLSA